jgi:replicative DNA helicase
MGVIGSMLLDPTAIDLVTSKLSGHHFVESYLGKIYDGIVLLKEMGKRTGDVIVICDELPKLLGAEVMATDGRNFKADVLKIFNTVPNAAHALYYADIVRECADRRALQLLGTKLLKAVENIARETPASELAELYAMELTNLGIPTEQPATDFGDIARQAVATLQREQSKGTARGVYMGLEELDVPNGPLLPSELMVIAARPGAGKTALGLQMLLHNATHQRPCLFVSLEMKDQELAMRYLCKAAEIDSIEIRKGTATPKDLAKLVEAANDCTFPLRVYSPPKATMQQIKAAIRHARIAHGIELVCVDYVGRIRPSKDERFLPRHEQIGIYIEGLKTLAKELDIAVIALAQLNRKAGDEVPQMHHLAESGTIEREADMILLLHHPEVEGKPPVVRESKIIVAKQRHGQIGVIRVGWRPSTTEFVSLCEAMAEKNYDERFDSFNNGGVY